jgi:hypothetical protein
MNLLTVIEITGFDIDFCHLVELTGNSFNFFQRCNKSLEMDNEENITRILTATMLYLPPETNSNFYEVSIKWR